MSNLLTEEELKENLEIFKKKLQQYIKEEENDIKELHIRCQKILLTYQKSQELFEELFLITNKIEDEPEQIPPITLEEINETEDILKKIGTYYLLILKKKRPLLRKLRKFKKEEKKDEKKILKLIKKIINTKFNISFNAINKKEQEFNNIINDEINKIKRLILFYYEELDIDIEDYEDMKKSLYIILEDVKKINHLQKKNIQINTIPELEKEIYLRIRKINDFSRGTRVNRSGKMMQITKKIQLLALLEKEREKNLEKNTS